MSLQHIALETRRDDVAAEVAFWALLGFSEVAPPSSLAGRATWLSADAGPASIHLLYTDDPAPSGHVAVVAPAFDATIALLAHAGHAGDPRTPHWGAARAYVRSPGGHVVEVMAAPPPPAG